MTIEQLQKENAELKKKLEESQRIRYNLIKMNEELNEKLIKAGLKKPAIIQDLSKQA